MDKRIGHGKGILANRPWYMGVGGQAMGHGYGRITFEQTGPNAKIKFSSSPAFEYCQSIGYAFGHGRCFYRKSSAFVDEALDENNNHDLDQRSESVSSDSDAEGSRPDSGIGI